MASRIGVSAEAAWWPGSAVYDRLHGRYGSVVSEPEPNGAVTLQGNGLTWVTDARKVTTLAGDSWRDPLRTQRAEELLRGLIDSVLQFHATSRDPKTKRLADTAERALSELSRMVGNPGELAIVSLGMNPPRGGKAQTFADSKDAGGAYRGYLIRGTQLHGVHISKGGHHVATVTDEAHAKAVIDMLHGDATPNVAGNPSGEVFGSDVLAIVYQHNEDPSGDVRVHTFGGRKEAKWRETARGVEVYDLPRTTGVYMSAEGESRVVMQHRRGLPLVQEF
jgi:hypothetical protein